MEGRSSALTVIATLETLLKETINSAALYREKEEKASNEIDRTVAYGMRHWCEGRACGYQTALDEIREAFDIREGEENDNGE